MSTATHSNVVTSTASNVVNASRIPTHPGSGRLVFACKAETWDEIFRFADAKGFQDETMSFMLDEFLKAKQEWLNTKRVH